MSVKNENAETSGAVNASAIASPRVTTTFRTRRVKTLKMSMVATLTKNMTAKA